MLACDCPATGHLWTCHAKPDEIAEAVITIIDKHRGKPQAMKRAVREFLGAWAIRCPRCKKFRPESAFTTSVALRRRYSPGPRACVYCIDQRRLAQPCREIKTFALLDGNDNVVVKLRCRNKEEFWQLFWKSKKRRLTWGNGPDQPYELKRLRLE